MNYKFFPLLITSLLLTSCSPKNKVTVNVIKDESIIYDENKQDYKDYTISLTLESLNEKLNNKDDFVLIFYGSNCQACKSIKPYIINYITSSQYVFYSLEYDYSLSDEYYEEVLNSMYEFPSIAFPRVYFTSNGECFYVKNGFNNEEHSNRNIKKLFDYYIN
ncbi:MAG: hypothetical protein ACI311_07050 [Bacilli bacterium]